MTVPDPKAAVCTHPNPCCMPISIPGSMEEEDWLVVEPTHLKHMSQIGNLPQIEVKI